MALPIMVFDRSSQAALKTQCFYPEDFFEGASAWMILSHFAWLNRLMADDIFGSLGRGRQSRLAGKTPVNWPLVRPPWSPEKLERQLRLSSKIVRLASGWPWESNAPSFTAAALRFCRGCLAVGVHSIAHQWRFLTVCPVHRQPLEDRCPACRQSIDYQFNSRTFRWPGHCPHCVAPLLSRARPQRPASLTVSLSQFCREVTRKLSVPVHPSETDWLPTWFSVFAHLPPSEGSPTPRDRARVETFNKLRGCTPSTQPGADERWQQADFLYRRLSRWLWRGLDRAEQRALGEWARQQHSPLETLASTKLSTDQFAWLAWRMTWERRQRPADLFRASLTPAVALALWFACNPKPEADEDEEGRADLLSELESKQLLEALLATHRRWLQLAVLMETEGTFIFQQNLVPIPEGFSAFRKLSRKAVNMNQFNRTVMNGPRAADCRSSH